jgi:hypothetical protein
VRDLVLPIVKAAITYFSIAAGAGFVMGEIRVTLLVPRLGARVAELIEMPFMLVVIMLAARFSANKFALPTGVVVRLSTGLIALGLLIAAELFFAVALQDLSLGQYIASRDPVSGLVYLLMLALFAALPLVITSLRFGRAQL